MKSGILTSEPLEGVKRYYGANVYPYRVKSDYLAQNTQHFTFDHIFDGFTVRGIPCSLGTPGEPTLNGITILSENNIPKDYTIIELPATNYIFKSDNVPFYYVGIPRNTWNGAYTSQIAVPKNLVIKQNEKRYEQKVKINVDYCCNTGFDLDSFIDHAANKLQFSRYSRELRVVKREISEHLGHNGWLNLGYFSFENSENSSEDLIPCSLIPNSTHLTIPQDFKGIKLLEASYLPKTKQFNVRRLLVVEPKLAAQYHSFLGKVLPGTRVHFESVPHTNSQFKIDLYNNPREYFYILDLVTNSINPTSISRCPYPPITTYYIFGNCLLIHPKCDHSKFLLSSRRAKLKYCISNSTPSYSVWTYTKDATEHLGTYYLINDVTKLKLRKDERKDFRTREAYWTEKRKLVLPEQWQAYDDSLLEKYFEIKQKEQEKEICKLSNITLPKLFDLNRCLIEKFLLETFKDDFIQCPLTSTYYTSKVYTLEILINSSHFSKLVYTYLELLKAEQRLVFILALIDLPEFRQSLNSLILETGKYDTHTLAEIICSTITT